MYVNHGAPEPLSRRSKAAVKSPKEANRRTDTDAADSPAAGGAVDLQIAAARIFQRALEGAGAVIFFL